MTKTIIEPKQKPLTNTIITNIRDKAQHKRVQEKLFEMGCEWYSGIKEVLDCQGEAIMIDEESRMLNYSCSTRAKQNYPNHTHITADEFLGEEKQWVVLEKDTPNIVNRFEDGIIKESKKINQEIFNLCYPIFNTPTEPSVGKGNKIMSIVSNAFKSKENKALEYFNLGTADKLNEDGRREFLDYIYETGDTTKKGFLAKIVEAYKEDKK